MRFTKGHGTANDFVVVADPDDALTLTDAQVAAICDRRTGIGADGILRLTRGDDAAPWFMDYRNADGGAVEMCGNGIRVAARYLAERDLATGPELRIGTRDGVKTLWLQPNGDITVDMGSPRDVTELPDGGVYVSMGNPHVVLFEDDTTVAPVTTVGKTLDEEWDGGTNVEFVAVESPTSLRMRVWERGVGETMSCGTGACAVAVAAAVRERASREVDIHLRGGILHVAWGADDRVLMTGPAVLVADGELRDDWLTTTKETA